VVHQHGHLMNRQQAYFRLDADQDLYHARVLMEVLSTGVGKKKAKVELGLNVNNRQLQHNRGWY
jgi:hypothetical protein